MVNSFGIREETNNTAPFDLSDVCLQYAGHDFLTFLTSLSSAIFHRGHQTELQIGIYRMRGRNTTEI